MGTNQDKPAEDKALESEKDQAPPRFLVVIADFQTDVQINVGAPVIDDFLKPLPKKRQRDLTEQVHHVFTRHDEGKLTVEEAVAETLDLLDLRERFELERVLRYFKRKVRESERKAKEFTKEKE